MNKKYLVINAGSSSLKVALYNMPDKKEIANGRIEKIGSSSAKFVLKYGGIKEKSKVKGLKYNDRSN